MTASWAGVPDFDLPKPSVGLGVNTWVCPDGHWQFESADPVLASDTHTLD